MASSDRGTGRTAGWSTDPLLNTTQQTPRFLRTQWDETSARSFGPWRIAPKSDPANGLMTDSDDSAIDAKGSDLSQPLEPTTVPEVEAEIASPWSESALAQLRDEAYQNGLREGQALQLAEFEAERQKERELIRHLGIELRSISQDPQRFFEPLKRLSLHLAEQLVRAELQISGQAIHGLVQSCIQQLDHPAQPVNVSLNPQDMKRLQAMGEAVTAHLDLEADPKLRPGSVRVRVQDSVVQDLIEHRLEPLARRLLPQPEAWMQNSSLVQDKVDAMPENTPKRDWDRQVIDVQDTDVKSTQANAPNTPDLPDTDTPV